MYVNQWKLLIRVIRPHNRWSFHEHLFGKLVFSIVSYLIHHINIRSLYYIISLYNMFINY